MEQLTKYFIWLENKINFIPASKTTYIQQPQAVQEGKKYNDGSNQLLLTLLKKNEKTRTFRHQQSENKVIIQLP